MMNLSRRNQQKDKSKFSCVCFFNKKQKVLMQKRSNLCLILFMLSFLSAQVLIILPRELKWFKINFFFFKNSQNLDQMAQRPFINYVTQFQPNLTHPSPSVMLNTILFQNLSRRNASAYPLPSLTVLRNL